MMAIEFSWAVALFLFFNIFLVVFLWGQYNHKQIDRFDIYQVNSFRQCPYCCYVFFDYRQTDYSTCPQCKSLVDQRSTEEINETQSV